MVTTAHGGGSPRELKRFALFGSPVSVDDARDSAILIFGEIFEPHRSDHYGDYWLGHWHIRAGQSKWFGDEVQICKNVYVDEECTEPKEPDYNSPTLLYVSGSTPQVEKALCAQGFTALRIDEV